MSGALETLFWKTRLGSMKALEDLRCLEIGVDWWNAGVSTNIDQGAPCEAARVQAHTTPKLFSDLLGFWRSSGL